MINYNWEIPYLGTYPTRDNHSNVVFQVHWRFQASDVDGNNTYFSEIYETTDIGYNASGSFTSFENLTKDQVVGWLEATLGQEAINNMKSRLSDDIHNQKNPRTTLSIPPWG